MRSMRLAEVGPAVRRLTLRRRRSRVPWIYLLYHREPQPPGLELERSPSSPLLAPQERRHVERRARCRGRRRCLPSACSVSASTRRLSVRQAADRVGAGRAARREAAIGRSSSGRRAIDSRDAGTDSGGAGAWRRRARARARCTGVMSTGVCAADDAGRADAGGAEAGRDHGDLHLALQRRIDDRAEDDVGVLVGRLLDDATTPRSPRPATGPVRR